MNKHLLVHSGLTKTLLKRLGAPERSHACTVVVCAPKEDPTPKALCRASRFVVLHHHLCAQTAELRKHITQSICTVCFRCISVSGMKDWVGCWMIQIVSNGHSVQVWASGSPTPSSNTIRIGSVYVLNSYTLK